MFLVERERERERTERDEMGEIQCFWSRERERELREMKWGKFSVFGRERERERELRETGATHITLLSAMQRQLHARRTPIMHTATDARLTRTLDTLIIHTDVRAG